MSIYFGSQTGTAEGFARILMEEGKSKGFAAKMVDLEDFDPSQLLHSKIAIFLIATYGEGEPTDNAVKFSKWLKNEDQELEANHLSKVNFSVFGLGNRQYEHFNRQGKLTNAGLENLGGNRIFEYGEGDDDASLEDDFENWRAKLWPSLVQQFHPDGMKNNAPSSLESTPRSSRDTRLIFDTIFIDGPDAKAEAISLNLVNTSTKHFFTAPLASITTNRELRSTTTEGSTRHIELSLRGISGGLKYETADNLAVLPENDSELVLKLCQCMDYNPKQVNEFF